ncbi:MAG: SAM-dependent methyltransferase [Ponticaulis sp.]|nr:SAM-dependent methyltransferase [Ponticaulis sp.]|tara:strand:- start:1505 stop:2230 length:726 start_codon:yes stop_codon:yes gene_type:complete
MASDNSPIALEAYEALAERYAAMAETKAENGYNEHPAMRNAIGDPSGLHVLDAGCGPGFLSRDLLDEGAASVSAFDISPNMVEIAKRNTGGKASCFVADLAQPQTTLEDQSFDLVVSSLAIDYVRDWSVPLAEFARALKPRGRLVMSVQHPMGAYDWYKPPSAFGVHLCRATWKGFGGKPVEVPDYYRSFEETINPVLQAGFVLRGVTETRPSPELKALNPRKFAQNDRFPTFMILDAVLT